MLDVPKGHISANNYQFLSHSIEVLVQKYVRKLLELEKDDTHNAYMQLGGSDGLSAPECQEMEGLSDKIFYIASSVDSMNGIMPMIVHIGHQSLVRLDETIGIYDHIPTILQLRNKLSEGFLISGVGAIVFQTYQGALVPLIQRDLNALTDGGKFTLPAGRADKTPGLTAYEEILEEIVLFGRKNNKLYLIIPFIEDVGISRKKAFQLVSNARLKYINTLLKGNNITSILDIQDLITAEPIFIPLQVSQKGVDIRTCFYNHNGEMDHKIDETGFFPMYDHKTNTYEMIRGFNLDITDFVDLIVGDGDGHGREVSLVSLEKIKHGYSSSDFVYSLNQAIKSGVLESN